MKNNKVYLSKDAIARHEDFEVWYEDGEVALSIKGLWESERDKIAIFGRKGGEIGHIKPDAKTLSYYIRMERWEYVFHTIRIFKHYYIEGMLWHADRSLSDLPLDFLLEGDLSKDVHVRLTPFRDKGECFEIKVKDVVKLRVAAAAVIAIAIKEEYKGLSEGEPMKDPTKLEKMKQWLSAGKGKTYEELLENDPAYQQ